MRGVVFNLLKEGVTESHGETADVRHPRCMHAGDPACTLPDAAAGLARLRRRLAATLVCRFAGWPVGHVYVVARRERCRPRRRGC